MAKSSKPYRSTFHLSGERPRSVWRRITPVTWLILALLVLFATIGVVTAVRLDLRARAGEAIATPQASVP